MNNTPIDNSGEAAKVQISDFFGFYPNQNDEFFNSKIAAKQEFSELKPEAVELPPRRGESYPHQKFNERYTQHYDRLLNIHEPGTGKSCIITHIAELAKQEYLKDPSDPTKINRAIILVKGPAVEENIRNQIVCKCTDRIYETEAVLKATDEKNMKNRITAALKEWYDIMSYNAFAKEINKFRREEDLEEYMSNKLILVDETHNIPTLADQRRKMQEIEDVEDIVFEESDYQTIHRAFHKGKRNKIYGYTATPMINKPSDIRSLMNLYLPMSHQMKFTDAEFEKLTFADLEPYFRGYVSYIRALDTGALETYPASSLTIDGFYTKIEPCVMSGFQYMTYLQSLGSGELGGTSLASLAQDESERTATFFDKQRNISNFVFPDGSYGTIGSERYLKEVGGKYQINTELNYGPVLRENITGLRKLEVLSAKFARTIEICLSKYTSIEPNQIEVSVNKGIVFIFFPDFVKGSAAITLGICMEANGYTQFTEKRSIFDTTEVGRSITPCGSAGAFASENLTDESEPKKMTLRPVRLDKRPRFALLTGDTSKPQIKTILDTVGAYENRYGQYLQVVIGSKASREGINIDNAITFIRESSGWNPSTDWQAKNRVFRSTSHITRINEVRQIELNAGATNVKTVIPVEVYNMASVYVGDPNSSLEPLKYDNLNLVDITMYKRSEIKDRQIRRIIRFMKRASIDCIINYERNVRPGDVNGSPVCDYEVCQYECAGVRKDLLAKTDKTTKILYYSVNEVANAVIALKSLFSKFYSISADKIYQLIPGIESIYIDMAIERMITENIRILDRLGISGYLREGNNGVIYLEKDPFTLRSQQENIVYNSALIGINDQRNNIFSDYAGILQETEDLPLLEELKRTDPNTIQFEQVIAQLSLTNRIKLLERALFNRSNVRNPFIDRIISIFNNFIFTMNEPLDELEESKVELASKGKGRGRKAKTLQPKIKKLTPQDQALLGRDIGQEGGTEKVVLHTLLGLKDADNTNYNLTNRYLKAEGPIRILKRSENIGWREVNSFEYPVYNLRIRLTIRQLLAPYEQYPVYGIMLWDGSFEIRDRETEDPKAVEDLRFLNKGKECRSWAKPKLIDILYRLGVPSNVPIPGGARQDELIAVLRSKNIEKADIPLEQFSMDKLIYFYQWYQSSYNRDDLCKIIEQNFRETGKLFTGLMPSAPPKPRQTSTSPGFSVSTSSLNLSSSGQFMPSSFQPVQSGLPGYAGQMVQSGQIFPSLQAISMPASPSFAPQFVSVPQGQFVPQMPQSPQFGSFVPQAQGQFVPQMPQSPQFVASLPTMVLPQTETVQFQVPRFLGLPTMTLPPQMVLGGQSSLQTATQSGSIIDTMRR